MMSDHEELYEDDFEVDELTSLAANSVSLHAASLTTSHRSAHATHGTASKGRVLTSTAAGPGGAAGKSGMESAAQQPMCSLGSSFSSYQSFSADPLLPSAHELSSSSSQSSMTSSRDPTDHKHPAKGSGSTPSAAGFLNGHRASSTADGTTAMVVETDFVRIPTSSSNLSAVTTATMRTSVSKMPEKLQIASSGAPKAYATLDSDDGVQVSASKGGAQLQRVLPSDASETESTASFTSSSTSTSSASSSAGRAPTTHHGMAKAGNSSVSEMGPIQPKRRKPVEHASQSSSDSSSSSDDEGSSRYGCPDGTSPPPFASAAAAVAPRSEAPVTRNVTTERHNSESGSNKACSTRKLLHQSNYTTVDVLEADDDRSHRRCPAEIDAAAAPVDDEEGEEDHDDASASGTMSSVAAQQQLHLAPLSSGAHSDTHTSLIPPASADHSLANHQHTSSHTINKTSLSSAMSPTQRTSSNRARLQSRRDNVSDHTGSHSSNFRSTMRLDTSSPHAPPHKPASSAVSAAAQRSSGAALRSSFNRRQVTSRPNSTMEARVFDGVYDFGEFCGASSAAGNSGDYAGKKLCTGAKPQQLSPTSLPSLSNYPTSTPMSEDGSLSKVPVTTTEPRTKAPTAVSKRGRAPESKERAALLERVAQLCEDVATWDSRIARQRSLMREEARRSDDEAVFSSGYSPVNSTNVARRRRASSGGKRQPESAEQAPNPKADIKGGSRIANARLTKLRQENEQLEARYARQGAGAAEMSVQALVVRADIQLQKVRLRLKEITATRRALENRDKRAAHTIEEVHRRMPTADELKDRQLNEGIYSRKRLLCTVKELKENLERTRAAIKMMKVRCTDLEAHVRHKHLSAITPKEYEALCDTRDANAKAIEKHKSAISVYAIAFAHELRNTSKSSCGSDAGGCISQSGCSSITTSPCKRVVTPVRSGATDKEQQQMIAEFEANKVNLLLQQKKSLLERKQAQQTVVDELRKRVQKYNEEIKSNHVQAGLLYLDSNSTAGTTACAPLCSAQSREPSPPILTTTSETRTSYGSTPVAGSGAVATRKRSLRDVLRSPVIRRTEASTDWAEAKGRGGEATPRLGGGDAVGCKRRQENVGGNANLLNRDSVALPALVQTGKGASRAEHRASLSALAMLVDSPVKGATQMGNGVTAGGKTTASSHDTIEGDIDAHDSIESMLHKIDRANKRLGRAVFGQDSREGVSPPLLLQELHEADGVKVANNVLADSNVFEEKSMPAKVNGSSGGYTGGSSHRDHATSAAGCVHHADGKAMPDEWSAEEEELEEELSVGRSDGSGRSTPEWLRND